LEYDELVAVAENEEMTEAMQARLNELEAAIETLKGAPVYDPADIAAGGAFVSLGFDGGLRVERGFIRKADETPAPVRTETEQATKTLPPCPRSWWPNSPRTARPHCATR
jgi:ParB family chromosome partitioning protein